jgi:hypothetical protein
VEGTGRLQLSPLLNLSAHPKAIAARARAVATALSAIYFQGRTKSAQSASGRTTLSNLKIQIKAVVRIT